MGRRPELLPSSSALSPAPAQRPPPSATQAVLSPRAAGHPSPPSPAETPQRQLLLPPCPAAQPEMCHPEMSLCSHTGIKGRVLGRGRVGSSLGELCPGLGPGHPAVSPWWHSDTTPWGHTGFGTHPLQPQAAPHVPPALLSPLAPFRATLAGPQACSSFPATRLGE